MQADGEEVDLSSLPPKTCSLCGVLKEMQDFGPKRGSKDGRDCYCRICSTLRRRYTIPVCCCGLGPPPLTLCWSVYDLLNLE
jgi:hypothetical protein